MYWKLSSQPWLQLRNNWIIRELSSSTGGFVAEWAIRRQGLEKEVTGVPHLKDVSFFSCLFSLCRFIFQLLCGKPYLLTFLMTWSSVSPQARSNEASKAYTQTLGTITQDKPFLFLAACLLFVSNQSHSWAKAGLELTIFLRLQLWSTVSD